MMTAWGSTFLIASSAALTATVLRSKVPSPASCICRFSRAPDASKAGLTKGIVLVHDRNPGRAEILGQMLDHGFGFLEVAGANIHHQGLVGLPQELGARKGSDERNACSGRDRLNGG